MSAGNAILDVARSHIRYIELRFIYPLHQRHANDSVDLSRHLQKDRGQYYFFLVRVTPFVFKLSLHNANLGRSRERRNPNIAQIYLKARCGRNKVE